MASCSMQQASFTATLQPMDYPPPISPPSQQARMALSTFWLEMELPGSMGRAFRLSNSPPPVHHPQWRQAGTAGACSPRALPAFGDRGSEGCPFAEWVVSANPRWSGRRERDIEYTERQ